MDFWQDSLLIGLASKSPRRQQLLLESKFNFLVIPNEADEDYPPYFNPSEVAPYLAQKKARQAWWDPGHLNVILAADSVVIIQEQVLGKPGDASEAKAMLQRLQNNWHTVITGVTLLGSNYEVTFSVETTVELAAMDEQEIDFYVERFDPLDKAGAYGIQEWIGHCKVKNIRGSFTNVMGLPMAEVYTHLKEFYLTGLGSHK